MATEIPVIKNGAGGATLYTALVSQGTGSAFQANPTLATGDAKISLDGGALNNLGTLPVVAPASGKAVKIVLSQAETNADNLVIIFSDAAGAEWADQIIHIQTAARHFDDHAFPATSGRSMVVDLAGLVDANVVKLGPTGSGTAQTAKDVGGAVPAAAAGASGGLLISGSNSGTTTLGALTVTGVTTHTGATVHTGNVSYVDGITVAAPSTLNRAGVSVTGNGTGDGLIATGGASAGGDGIAAVAGGGVDIRGAITGNVTGNLSGSIGSVATGGIAAASFATGAVDAAALAADAGTEIGTAVWASVARTLTSSLDPSAATVAAAVWDLDATAHQTGDR